jgi:hypothetical protein
VLDTGAAKTVVELNYCRSEGLPCATPVIPWLPQMGRDLAPPPAFIRWAMFG